MGIEIEGVSKQFIRMGEGGVSEPFIALNDFTLEIRDQEFVSFIGPSGCGKTTMLRIIDGLTDADAGKVEIDGKAVTGPGPDRAVVSRTLHSCLGQPSWKMSASLGKSKVHPARIVKLLQGVV